MSIYDEYFEYVSKYVAIYGPRTVVIMQVGKFYEMYGYKTSDFNSTDNIEGSLLNLVNSFTGLKIAKKQIISNRQIYMAGFGTDDSSVSRFLPFLLNEKITVVEIVQEDKLPGAKKHGHKLIEVHSIGTFFEAKKTSNNMMSIWLEKYKNRKTKKDWIIYGVSVINLFNGNTTLFEFNQEFDNNVCLSELKNCMSSFEPCEIIWLSELPMETFNMFCNDAIIHSPILNESVLRCKKPTYQEVLLSEFYKSSASTSEFETHPVASQSLCYLLNFIQEHNPCLVKNLEYPIYYNASTRIVLANHTLAQIFIVDGPNADKFGKLSSVMTFLNQCCTAAGKRLFESQLTTPSFDETWLMSEYDRSDYFISQFESVNAMRAKLSHVKDIEKISRLLICNKVRPYHILFLYQSLVYLRDIKSNLIVPKNIGDYLLIYYTDIQKLIDFFESVFDFSKMNDEIVLQPSISAEFLETCTNIALAEDELNAIRHKLYNGPTEGFIKCSEQYELLITKSRSVQLNLPHGMQYKPTKTANIMCIDSNYMTELRLKMIQLNEQKATQTKNLYREQMQLFELTLYPILHNTILFLARLDVALCKAYIARMYHYCRPELMAPLENDGSCVFATNLRHALIEHLDLRGELYVPNNVNLNESGMLIYGTNEVGKSSLIKSVGIAIILAQAGIFVPCTEFKYRPYKSIYSRILNGDNMHTGQSTFGVEMSELRVILREADKNSLILGDELCSGTDMSSAVNIFMSSLEYIHKRRCSFMFATHFHEIANYDEIKLLDRLTINHLSVHYDREQDKLIYDRKLADGPGASSYGLEVCKAMHLPTEFIERAFELRNKHSPVVRGILNYSQSKYNNAIIKGLCEVCRVEMGADVHHIMEQYKADPVSGYICDEETGQIFSKNHAGNLKVLCKSCHNKEHHSENNSSLGKRSR